jgi:hypothetical protein
MENSVASGLGKRQLELFIEKLKKSLRLKAFMRVSASPAMGPALRKPSIARTFKPTKILLAKTAVGQASLDIGNERPFPTLRNSPAWINTHFV